jgi:hypothetical protein
MKRKIKKNIKWQEKKDKEKQEKKDKIIINFILPLL